MGPRLCAATVSRHRWAVYFIAYFIQTVNIFVSVMFIRITHSGDVMSQQTRARTLRLTSLRGLNWKHAHYLFANRDAAARRATLLLLHKHTSNTRRVQTEECVQLIRNGPHWPEIHTSALTTSSNTSAHQITNTTPHRKTLSPLR